MLKVSGLIKDTTIISDYSKRKGYQAKLVDSVSGKEIDNPESEADYFDRILTQHIEHVVKDQRDKKSANEHKADKVEL